MKNLISNLGGRSLPGLRGDSGRDGLPGRPGLRYTFYTRQKCS